MGAVVKIASKVAARWNDIGYQLDLEYEDMDNIEEDLLKTNNAILACKKMMNTWIRSAHGRTPKTWRTFVLVLEELKINCDFVFEMLQKESAQ